MNDNSRLPRQPADQVLQIAASERDTAGSWSETGPRNMDEYRAAAAGDARPNIVVDFHDQIIKPIGTPKAIAWFIGRPPEGPVVAAILRVFAPSIVGCDPPDRQLRARARQAVRPPPQSERMKTTRRRRAIAFAFYRLDPGPAQSREDGAVAA